MSKRYNNYVSVRMDEKLKKDFEAFCEDCEMTVSGAVNLLVNHTVKKKEIPFRIMSSVTDVRGAYEGGERQDVRLSVRIDKENREAFQSVCKEIGIPMGRIIKMFMTYCVKAGELPFLCAIESEWKQSNMESD